ncbi:hypothetical protein J4Q44_G00232690 [Coregonus suidteri]|uniref:Uncharacterized protein n=1 Tax=Coregonus suidteri TaxID=861788 RepID=A0AAN8LC42_9TELE
MNMVSTLTGVTMTHPHRSQGISSIHHALRASHGHVTSGSLPLRKARHRRRDTPSRYVLSVDEDDEEDEDSDEGCVRWRKRCRPNKATEGRVCTQRPGGCLGQVMSDWLKMEEELATLRQLMLRCAVSRHAVLEQLRAGAEQMEGRSLEAVELQKELWENESRVGSLERTAAQKELQLLGFHEEKSALKSERDGLQREFQSLREQHSISMRETQEQALRQMQRELKKLKEELALTHEEHIQQAHRQAEEKKTVAFREQAISHTQHIESTQSCIQIHSTIEQERKKWEIEKEKALQVQCGILEEQGRDALERRVQELESECHVQQREKVLALVAMRRSLREEHQAELQRLRRHMEQEGQREALRLEQVVQQAEEKAGRRQVLLGEREHSHIRLQQELDSQRRSTQQLSRDKELELHIQREPMGMKKEQALDSLKERLIQEHIEELSGLQRSQVREGGDEAGGVAASLRRQLQAKDQELRLVQRSMGQWKEQITARLACKFEEELTAEQERFLKDY